MMRKIARVLEDAWVYLGSLAAMSLLVGVLGMGIYHMMTWREDRGHVEYFLGAVNTPDESLPVGLAPLPESVADGGEMSHIRFEYADDGKLKRLVHVDGSGEVCAMPGSHVAEQRIRYDENGRVACKANYDASGNAVTDAAGIASRHFFYDDRGNCVRTELRDAEGALASAPLPGYAVVTTRYDERNRPLLTEYWDADLQATINAVGESRVVYFYDDAAHEIQRRNYVGESLASNRLGYAVEKHTLSDGGRILTVEWLDEALQPTLNSWAGTSAVCSQQATNGTEPRGNSGCASHLIHRDSKGRPEWESYRNEEGAPQMNAALGYAERHCRYRADGAIESEAFVDADGLPAACAERRYPELRSGEMPLVLSLHRDGRTELRPLEQPRH